MARRRSVWSAFVAASVLLVLVGTGRAARLPALLRRFRGHAVNVGDDPNYLLGVSVRSACDAWAVGGFERGSKSQTLVERWNGTRWRHVESPNPGSHTQRRSGRRCRAFCSERLGRGLVLERAGSRTLAEHWNGSKWKVKTTPNPAGPHRTDRLLAVDASSGSSVWAVGFYEARSARSTVARPPVEWIGVEAGAKSQPRSLERERAHGRERAFTDGRLGRRLPVDCDRAARAHPHWDGSDWTRFTIPDPPGSREDPR